jgi:hypothetical protein
VEQAVTGLTIWSAEFEETNAFAHSSTFNRFYDLAVADQDHTMDIVIEPSMDLVSVNRLRVQNTNQAK